MPFRFPNAFTGEAAAAAAERIPLEQAIPRRTTLGCLEDAAAAAPAKIALRYLAAPDAAPQDMTYAALAGQVRRTANAMHALGVGARDAVVLLLPNHPATVVAQLGAQAAGIACPINHYLREDAIARIVDEAKARLIITWGPDATAPIFAKLPAILAACRDRPQVVLAGPRAPGFAHLDDACAAQDDRALASGRVIDEHDGCALFHTGGTTGLPKLARHTHRGQVIAAWLCAYGYGLRPGDVVANGMPMFHVGGSIACTTAPLFCGATSLQLGLAGYRDPAFAGALWPVIERERVSVLIAVPAIHGAALDALPAALPACVRVVSNAATTLPRALKQRYAVLGKRMVDPWGLTEATLAVSLTPQPDGDNDRAGSVGTRLPYCRVEARRVLPGGALGAPLPRGEAGAICVAGPSVFPGYLRAEADCGTLLPDGWLCTGDLGRVDADGFIYLGGRAKDLIIRGGHNIDPGTIEEPLARHPDVALVAAVGWPDERVGEVPVAFVQLRPGAGADASTLLAFAGREIAERAAVPRRIVVLERLPLTAVGKVFKPELRERAAVMAVGEALAEVPVAAIDAHHDARRGLVVRVRAAAPERVRQRLEKFALEVDCIEAEAP